MTMEGRETWCCWGKPWNSPGKLWIPGGSPPGKPCKGGEGSLMNVTITQKLWIPGGRQPGKPCKGGGEGL